jgi:hypothetical protein
MRDRVYRKLIELSPASYNNKIVNGRGGLCDRRISNHSQYGSLPATVNERDALVERLLKQLEHDEGKAISFSGIPGFWKDSTGAWRLWNRFDSNDELLLIPFVGRDGLIQACQIKFMRYAHGRSGNYVWLSSKKERTGTGPGSPLHHVAPPTNFDSPVLVTEGALKAATANRFLSNRYVVGNSGVATSHREIVDTARRKALEIAFDSDSFTNPHVARALASLIKLRFEDQRLVAYNDEVRILAWDRRLKGIDEALLAGVPVSSLTVAEWLKELTPACLEQASSATVFCLGAAKQAAGRMQTSFIKLQDELL